MGVTNILDASGVPHPILNVSLSCPVCDAVLMPLKLYTGLPDCPCCGHPKCGLHTTDGKQQKSTEVPNV